MWSRAAGSVGLGSLPVSHAVHRDVIGGSTPGIDPCRLARGLRSYNPWNFAGMLGIQSDMDPV